MHCIGTSGTECGWHGSNDVSGVGRMRSSRWVCLVTYQKEKMQALERAFDAHLDKAQRRHMCVCVGIDTG